MLYVCKKIVMTPVYIADDHQIVLEGLQSSLNSNPNYTVVKCFSNGTDLKNELPTHEKGILILDLNLTDYNGIDILEHLHKEKSCLSVFVLTMYNDISLIEKCKKLGAKGYVLKNSTNEELLYAMNSQSEDFYYGKGVKRKNSSEELFKDGFLMSISITKREIEIIKLLAKDFSSHEIAKELNLSSHTVDTHRRNLIKKLNVKGVAGVINFAHENNFI
jgi:DNA-binding NarL/FixJ family response regulator